VSVLLFLVSLLSFLVVSIYLAFFSAPAVRSRELAKQARLDYQQARGTAHLKLLATAIAHREKPRKECEQSLFTAQKEQATVENKQATELDQALARNLIRTRLMEVPGIGAVLCVRILTYGFYGRLSDLNHLNIEGVGEARQQAIQAWVTRYQQRWSELLQGEFAGKAEILQRYAPDHQRLGDAITSVQAKLAEIDRQLERPKSEVAKLKAVREADFERTLRGRAQATPDMDCYLRGVFAEWEPMPDWFRDLVEEAD
jgi:hypothetical protein